MTEPPTRAIDVAWPQETWRQWVRELQAQNAALRENYDALLNISGAAVKRLDAQLAERDALLRELAHYPIYPEMDGQLAILRTRARALIANKETARDGG